MAHPKHDEKIKRVLPTDYHVGLTDIAEWVNAPRQSVWCALQRLERNGLLKVHGRNGNRKPLKIIGLAQTVSQ